MQLSCTKPCVAIAQVIRARTEASVRRRAFLAADLANGVVRIHGCPPGMSQALAALIMNSTPLNVGLAFKQMDDREDIIGGMLPLQPRGDRTPTFTFPADAMADAPADKPRKCLCRKWRLVPSRLRLRLRT